MKNKFRYQFKCLYSLLVYVSLCWIFSSRVVAQSGNFKTYSQDEGLTELFIYTTAQDSSGYLWVGTGNGMFRFDGKKFKSYLDESSSQNSFVKSSLTDRSQQLWVGHYNGKVSRYLMAEDRFKEVTLTTPFQSNINQLVQGKGDYLWVVSQSNGLAKIQSDGSQSFYKTSPDWLVYCIAEINEKELLVGTNEGLFLCDIKDGEITPTYRHPYFEYVKITDIQPNKFDQGFIICTEDAGFYFYKSSQMVEQMSKKEGLPSNNIKTVCQKSANELWIATADKGLVLLDPSVAREFRIKRLFNESTGTKDNYINTIFLDREQNIWIGSYGSGLWEYRGAFFTFYNNNQFVRVFAATQSAPNNYWLGTESGIISLRTEQNTEKYGYLGEKHPLAGKKINALFTDKNGMVWVGTDGEGTYLFDPENPKKVEELNERKDFDGRKVKSIIQDHAGNIWLSTTLRGVFKYVVDEDVFYNYSTRNPIRTGNTQHFPDNIQNILVDKEGRIWVVAPGFGVGYFKEANLHMMRDESIKNMEFNCIAEDFNGDIWLGTVGFGAFRYDGERFQQLTTSEGLISNYVKSIGSDTLGNVWFGASNGITKFEIPTNTLRTFGKSAGLENIEIHPNSFYKDNDQNIWFGTNRGALRYDPLKDNYNELAPNTQITAVYMDDDLVKVTDSQVFPYRKYKLRFEFVGLTLKEPERVKYEYLLEGFDDEWRKSSERFVVYPKVDDGQYVFRVRAANSDGLWNEKAVAIAFSIKKPIWEEPWFYIIGFLLIGGGIYAYNHARLLRYRKANQVLEEKVAQRTEELVKQSNRLETANIQLDEKNNEIESAYQKLVSLEEFKDKMTGMIVHDMKNPLNSIIALSKEAMPAVEQSGKQMLQMVMNILDIQKFEDTQVQLNLGEYKLLEVVEEALDQVVFLVKQKGQSVELDVSSVYRGNFDWNIIVRVLVNLLTNAIKYSPPSGVILISAQPNTKNDRDFLELQVIDSGEGIPAEHVPYIFDKFYQTDAKSSGAVRSTGLGLTFCKMVIEAHEGDIGVRSVVGEGSTFYFSIPRLADATEEKMPQRVIGLQEKEVSLSENSKVDLTEIVHELQKIDIYETSKNLSLLSQLEDHQNNEIIAWKDEMENALFSFNESKYEKLMDLVGEG